MLLATYSMPDGVSGSELDERIRIFNDAYPAGKGFRGTDGTPMVQRYVISDKGITMGNFRSQLIVFGDIAARFSESIAE